MKRLAVFAASCAIALPAFAQTVATVNGQELTQKQVDQFVSLLIKQGAQDTPDLRAQVKQEMINRLVAVQAAEKAGITNRPEVQQEIALAREGILVRALMADYLSKHPVSDAAIKAEYEQIKKAQGDKKEYKLRHILVDSEQKAKELIASIKAKKSTFEDAAKKNSKDPGSGKNGGDLGWAPTSNYVPEFAQAAEKLKKGEMTSAPVKTQFGWHIIRAEDTRASTFPKLEEVKPQLEEMMRQQELAKYQDTLMKEASIKQEGAAAPAKPAAPAAAPAKPATPAAPAAPAKQ